MTQELKMQSSSTIYEVIKFDGNIIFTYVCENGTIIIILPATYGYFSLESVYGLGALD